MLERNPAASITWFVRKRTREPWWVPFGRGALVAAQVASCLIAIGFEGALIAGGRGDGSCPLALFGDVHEG
ncbi:MAG: hypothetical protein AAFN70_17775, partial [Planctomycetota bacterium]